MIFNLRSLIAFTAVPIFTFSPALAHSAKNADQSPVDLNRAGGIIVTKEDPSFKGRAMFKGRDTSWGVFYPTDYMLAIFDSFETAQQAKEIMLSAGYSEDEVDAVPCDYVISDIEKGIKNATLLNRIKQRISRAIGREACYWESDLKLAKQGAGFLAVYCPTDYEAERVLRLLKPKKPKVMRRYERLVIEELV